MTTLNEELKAAVPPELYAKVMASIKMREDAIRAEYQVANVLRGALKSWTVYLGAALVALPELVPLLTPHLQELLDAETYKRLMQIFGIAVILVRFKTTQPLSTKGTT